MSSQGGRQGAASRRWVLGVRHALLPRPNCAEARGWAGCISRRPRRPNLLVKLSPFRSVGRTVGRSARVEEWEACKSGNPGLISLLCSPLLIRASAAGPCQARARLLGPGCPGTGMGGGHREKCSTASKKAMEWLLLPAASRPDHVPFLEPDLASSMPCSACPASSGWMNQ